MMEKIGQKVLLNIDQVARLTGVRKSTLRYWEKCFPEFLKPERTTSFAPGIPDGGFNHH